jgi:hypothetical protein
MDWLKTLFENSIKGKVEDAEIEKLSEDFVSKAKKDLGKNFIPKADFNEKNEELKVTKAKMEELQGKVAELAKTGENLEAVQAEKQKIIEEFEGFKTEAAKRILDTQKKTAIQNSLRKANAADDAIDLLTTQFDLEKIELDEKGDIKDWESMVKPVREQRKGLFGEVVTQGGTPPNPPSGDVGNDYVANYSKARETGNMVEAIKIKQQAAKEGVFI